MWIGEWPLPKSVKITGFKLLAEDLGVAKPTKADDGDMESQTENSAHDIVGNVKLTKVLDQEIGPNY